MCVSISPGSIIIGTEEWKEKGVKTEGEQIDCGRLYCKNRKRKTNKGQLNTVCTVAGEYWLRGEWNAN